MPRQKREKKEKYLKNIQWENPDLLAINEEAIMVQHRCPGPEGRQRRGQPGSKEKNYRLH